tara:strand:- start:37 stop:537 length:501 start_codon:yes stop_codon:yes gene_type:complete
MKIMIIGHAQHGKDTVAELLRDKFDYKLVPASWTFADQVLRDKLGYKTTEECFEDRVNHRKLWFNEIREYNTPDETALVRLILSSGSDLYVGCRRRGELEAIKYLFDYVVWVDRSKFAEPESIESMELNRHDADTFVSNNGSLLELETQVDILQDSISNQPNLQEG